MSLDRIARWVVSSGKYTPSEVSVVGVPRDLNPARRAAIYFHGAGGTGRQVLDGTSQKGVLLNTHSLVSAGMVVMSCDVGGTHTHGNDTFLTAAEAAWEYLKTTGLCATDGFVGLGASMGFDLLSRFAAAHPSWVTGMVGWVPYIDIEDIRTRDALGMRNGLNTAWGLPAGSYIGGADQTPVPPRGKPLDASNLSAVASIPTHLFYSSADTVCTSAAVDAYAAGRANVTKHLVSTSLEHSDAAILAADVPTVVELVSSWA